MRLRRREQKQPTLMPSAWQNMPPSWQSRRQIKGSRHSMPCGDGVLHHGSETWGPKTTELQRHHRSGRTKMCWICLTKGRGQTPTALLLQPLGIGVITAGRRSQRLRWYGNVQRATLCIKSITFFLIPETGQQGRRRKTLSDCVKIAASNSGLAGVYPENR